MKIKHQSEAKDSRKERLKLFISITLLSIIVILVATGCGKPRDLIDLPEEEYREQCETYSYDDIARTPDAYEKKLAKFTGKVVQVLKDGDELQMRVNVTPTEYGSYYEDTLFVYYTITDGENILEDDLITMYGELRGMQDYKTVFGAQVSVPRIYVKYIDIVK